MNSLSQLYPTNNQSEIPSPGQTFSVSQWLGRVWTYLKNAASSLFEFISNLFQGTLTPSEPLQKVTIVDSNQAPPLPNPVSLAENQHKPTESPPTENPIKKEHSNSSLTEEDIEDLNYLRNLKVGPLFIPYSKIQNVPDDGSCLFYAIGIGLKKLCPHHAKKWNVANKDLQGNLYDAEKLLKPMGRFLREAAVNYLFESRKRHDALGEDLESFLYGVLNEYNETIDRDAKERFQSVADDYKMGWEINELKQSIESKKCALAQSNLSPEEVENLKESIQRDKQSIAELEKTYEIELAKWLDRLDLQRAASIEDYLDKSRSENFYGSLAHIYALSHLYQIPIVVWRKSFDDSRAFETEKIGNREFNIQTIETAPGRKENYIPCTIMGKEFAENTNTPILEIVYLNDKKHYMYKNP